MYYKCIRLIWTGHHLRCGTPEVRKPGVAMHEEKGRPPWYRTPEAELCVECRQFTTKNHTKCTSLLNGNYGKNTY